MNDALPDPLLDAKLRKVPLPADLLARLRTASVPDDQEFDQALRDVPLPDDFSLRLAGRVSDLTLDETLCDVAVPGGLLAKLHVIPEIREPAPWRQLARAACLLLIVGGLYGVTLNSLFNAVRPQAAVAETLPLIDLGPLELTLRQTQMPVVYFPGETDTGRSVSRFSPPPAEPVPIAVEYVQFDRHIPRGVAGQLMEFQSTGNFKPDEDIFLLQWGALGAAHFADTPQPELIRIQRPRAPGVDLPIVRGYDRLFWLKNGIHPPISPEVHPKLQTSRLMLTNRTDSVALTRKRIASRRLPDPSAIRVEDFLAAVDYRFPGPSRPGMAIHTAAGPAIFGEDQHQLLQVGVKVGRAPRRRTATHLTVALDISTSMATGERLDVAKQAIAKLADYAGPDDRISLVAFHHDVVQVVELLDSQQFEQLITITAPLRGSGGDNLAAGLQQAISILLGSGLGDQIARSLVVLTDAQDQLPANAKDLANRLLTVARKNHVRSTFVQIGAITSDLPFATSLQDVGHVTCVQAETPDEVLWELVEGLTGASVAVAVDPVIQVDFNPAAVRAYRLVGHGTLATSGLESVSESTTLHNDEEATALYEVWLRPSEHDEVAWVRAQWRDPRTGQRLSTARESVRRHQFATSHEEMPLSLQAAAAAAEIGQVLSGGYDFELSDGSVFHHHKKSRDVRELATACRALNPGLESWSDFRELVDLLDTLDNVRRSKAP